MLAGLEAAWTGEPAPNSYPLREVLVTYLQRLVHTAETLTALGAEVRNEAWDERLDAPLPVSSRTLVRRLAELDAPRILVLHHRLVRRQGRRRFRAAVDSTVLAVMGRQYEQAGEHFVPQAGHAQRGYRLYVLFLLDERVPVAFFIQEDVAAWEEAAEVNVAAVLDQLTLEGASPAQAAPTPADVLWRPVDESCQVLFPTWESCCATAISGTRRRWPSRPAPARNGRSRLPAPTRTCSKPCTTSRLQNGIAWGSMNV